LYLPGFFNVPVICPVLESRLSPEGSPSAENIIGRSPAAAILNKNGDPGRTPNTFAPLMRGVEAGFGVRITASSMGGISSFGLALWIRVIFKSTQSAWSQSYPSPASRARSDRVLTPLTSMEKPFAASPGFIRPLLQTSFPSAVILKTTEPRPLVSSSRPANPDNSTPFPSSSSGISELACVPMPF